MESMVRKNEEQREEDVEATRSNGMPEAKRMKTAVEGSVDEFELASAVALASLATLASPPPVPATTMEADSNVKTAKTPTDTVMKDNNAFGHARTASNTSVASTTSAEQREDLQSLEPGPSQDEQDPAPVTPEKSQQLDPKATRRVHFAPGVKEEDQASRRHGHAQLIQRLQLPSSNAGAGRMVPPHPRNTAYASYHPHSQHAHHYSHHSRTWPRTAHGPPPAFLPPPPPPPPHGGAPTNPWVCDYCHVASFSTYQEACQHEESCPARLQSRSPSQSLAYPPQTRVLHHHPQAGAFSPLAHHDQSVRSAPRTQWHDGSIALGLKEKDHDWLPEDQCFIRMECIEAFSAQESDLEATAKKCRIALHQVGIRCCFCKDANDQEIEAFVSFPNAVSGIQEVVQRWKKSHVPECQSIPDEVKAKLSALAAEEAGIQEKARQSEEEDKEQYDYKTVSVRQYWVDSAKALGMVDTLDGIRFGRDPNASALAPDYSELETSLKLKPRGPSSSSQPAISDSMEEEHAALPGGEARGDFIVDADDTCSVPPYVYFLMRQVESCRFTEADRFVARSKGPIGYPGFQCRYCHGHAGLGKYFPVSSKSLSTNSTSQNIHAHLLKCRLCPVSVKSQLVTLKEQKAKSPRLEPGWRKIFFDKIWFRLHGSESTSAAAV